MTRLLNGRSITVRITAGFVCAMAVVLALSSAFIYERVAFALNRSIRDVPRGNRFELDARRRHRDEALRELLAQLAVAYGAVLVISGVVGYRVARAALDPVEEMRRRAASGSQDASVRLPVPDSDDEVSRLAQTLNELLERIQRGVAREHRLIADASHELRTPLGLMLMQIDLALSRERSPHETRLALERLRAETQRLARLANDLLLLARADEGQLIARLEAVDVRAAMLATRDRFDGRDAEISVNAPVETVVLADPDRLAQALDNLVDNAIRHGGGRLDLHAVTDDAEVVLHVCDDGPGFPAALAGGAFDRFARGSSGRTGSSAGLGLAIVAAIAEALGGRSGAENRPGGGADVWLSVPAAHGAAASSSVHEGR
jgi:two-component system OmpR family sensor kinase